MADENNAKKPGAEERKIKKKTIYFQRVTKRLRATQTQTADAQAALKQQMEKARTENHELKVRQLDHFTAVEMQDPQMIAEAEKNFVLQQHNLNDALEEVYGGIEKSNQAAKKVETAAKQLRKVETKRKKAKS